MGSTYSVHGIQMEPGLGAARGATSSGSSRGSSRRRTRGPSSRSSPSARLSGYGFSSREEGLAHAVRIDGPEVAKVAELAARDGLRLRLRAARAGRPQALQRVRARRPRRDSWGPIARSTCRSSAIDRFADPGDRPFAVHDLGGLRVGMHICYDGSFPESARVLTLLGADLVVLPTNWPTHSECAAEHMIPTRAMENTVYFMAVNRVGEESGFRFIGSQLDRRPVRQDPGSGRRGRGDAHRRRRPAEGPQEAPGARARAGTRSIGSATGGRISTARWLIWAVGSRQ